MQLTVEAGPVSHSTDRWIFIQKEVRAWQSVVPFIFVHFFFGGAFGNFATGSYASARMGWQISRKTNLPRRRSDVIIIDGATCKNRTRDVGGRCKLVRLNTFRLSDWPDGRSPVHFLFFPVSLFFPSLQNNIKKKNSHNRMAKCLSDGHVRRYVFMSYQGQLVAGWASAERPFHSILLLDTTSGVELVDTRNGPRCVCVDSLKDDP